VSAAFDPHMHGLPPAAPLPPPRGPRSAALVNALPMVGSAANAASTTPVCPTGPAAPIDPLVDDDLHLALYLAYELHYRGLPGVAEEAEWDPVVLGIRRELEAAFEAALRAAVHVDPVDGAEVGGMLRAEAREGDGPLSRFLQRAADAEQFREFAIHRSAYHLKEADPHSFAIPRLAGPAKAAMVEIQADEYGGGDAAWMHSYLFASMMHGLGMFELTSSLPNRRYGNGLRRLGWSDPDTTRFFDEHVEADAVHEAIATNELVGSLVAAEPALAVDVLFGTRALALLDSLSSTAILRAWRAGRTSLLPVPDGGSSRVA